MCPCSWTQWTTLCVHTLSLPDSSSWCPDDLLSGDPLSPDPVGCVELLASLPECRPILEKLMRDKNLDGYTPFMAAIACKVRSPVTLFLTCVCVYKRILGRA